MTVILSKGHPNRMAEACHLPEFASDRSLWKTKPLDESPAPYCDVAGPLRVAIADDCKDGADSLAELFKLWGHEAKVAYGGAEALQMIRAYGPDVVVLDIAMPKVTGWQVARHLRRLSRFERTLLIAITGYADKVHRLISLAAGFDYVFAKPCEPETLHSLMSLDKVRLRGAGSLARL
jgi:CheY-like chemotaxis protein